MPTFETTVGPSLRQFISVYIFDLVEKATLVVASLVLLVFFWGLARFIMNLSGDVKAVKEGKDLMVWGTIALFVMVSLWGILRFIHSDIGFGNLEFPGLPEA